MTTDPLSWVRAEMDAAEKAAMSAAERAWSPHWEYDHLVHEIRDLNNGNTLAGIYHDEIGRHVEATDPAAVLRRIAADRKLLELHAESDFRHDPDDGPGDYSWTARCDGCYEDAPCTTVRLIAESWGWTEDAT